MALVLFAWELGGDYGHLARLLPVAQSLQSRGHTVAFAVRDLLGAEAILAPHGIRTFQAPLWIGHVTNLPDPMSYPEMLMRFGFLNARALTGICRAWRNLVALLKPDLLVLDHAPTALLATRGLGLPRINFGDGFCIPPPSRPMPPFRWWQRENLVRLQDSERHAVAAANQVLQTLDAPPLIGMADLQQCDDTLLCTFPALDHYPDRPAASYLGPIYTLGQGLQQPWPGATPAPRVFAYLKSAYAGLEAVLSALQGSGAQVLAHVSGAARQTLTRFSAGTMRVLPDPLQMAQMAGECDLAVCHGGAGTTAAMLLAGKPLLLLPMQMEQTMTARRLAALGAAVAVPPDATGQLPRVLKKVLADSALLAAAQTFAGAHADYDQHATIAAAADRCEVLLGTRS